LTGWNDKKAQLIAPFLLQVIQTLADF
jgi:hypothetical protein